MWKWVDGFPQMLQNSEMQHVQGITLTSGFSKRRLPIRHREVSESHVTLGARMNPPCDNIDQVIYLRKEANRISNLIITSNLSSWEVFFSYQYCWTPSITYLLSTTTMSEHDLHDIEIQATQSFLLKMGFNWHFPWVVCWGPLEFGGLTLRDLLTE